MGILGIRNRTENWKTAQYFTPFFECNSVRESLVKQLLEPLGKDQEGGPSTVKIELFWKGMRDYIDMLRKEGNPEPTSEDLAERYSCRFHDLRERIEKFDKCNTLKTRNYNLSEQAWKDNLYTNLSNTEIDIVLETSKHLYIGEAKGETTFQPNDKRVLMHQLIREYVMATILNDLRGSDKKIVPFVVGDNPENLKEPHPNLRHIHQISFMIDQGWLKEENVLSWDCIRKIAESAPTAS